MKKYIFLLVVTLALLSSKAYSYFNIEEEVSNPAKIQKLFESPIYVLQNQNCLLNYVNREYHQSKLASGQKVIRVIKEFTSGDTCWNSELCLYAYLRFTIYYDGESDPLLDNSMQISCSILKGFL